MSTRQDFIDRITCRVFFFGLIAWFTIPSLVGATPILVNSGSSLPIVETFTTPFAVYDPYVVGSVARISESFAGQTVSIIPGFDLSPKGFESVSGVPSTPLTLQLAQNGAVCTWSGGELQGLLSNTDFSNPNVGEGAISILFLNDVSGFGLDLTKLDGGTVKMQFFSRSGVPFDTVNLSGISGGTYGFRSSDGVSTFAGVTITNVDNSGICIDNLRIAVSSTWATNTDGKWSTTGNWTSGVPSGQGTTALFTGATTAAVNVDSPMTVGRIFLDAGTAGTNYTLSGSAITLDNTGGTGTGASINVASGNHTINSPMILATDATISGSGSVNLAGGVSGGHTLTVLGNATASSIQVDTLIIGSTGTVAVPEPGTIALLGIGLAGLMSGAWRKRARVK
jgi:hypothetical protein